MYICICISICIYIYTYIYTHIYTCLHIFMYAGKPQPSKNKPPRFCGFCSASLLPSAVRYTTSTPNKQNINTGCTIFQHAHVDPHVS